MNVPPIVHRHPSLRWLAPLGIVGVAGLAATGMFRAQATSESLPETSPGALIAAVQAPHVTGFSGTVVSRLALGLPELPAIGNAGNGSSLTSLLSGSHTVQVWYGGADKQRIALLGATDETDLFRSGRQVWQWSSADHVALHTLLPKHTDRAARIPSPAGSLTPSGLANDALEALDPSTKMAVKTDLRVANRSAYELILTPRTTSSRIRAVHISVDGKTKIPLGVQVFARGERLAAIDVAFTSIRFAQPSASYFRFTAPADATVREFDLGKYLPREVPAAGPQRIVAIGRSWSTIYTYRTGKPIAMPKGALRRGTTPVHGSWGHGRLFESSLLSVLITDDGRVYAGAVDPDALYAAAGAK